MRQILFTGVKIVKFCLQVLLNPKSPNNKVATNSNKFIIVYYDLTYYLIFIAVTLPLKYSILFFYEDICFNGMKEEEFKEHRYIISDIGPIQLSKKDTT